MDQMSCAGAEVSRLGPALARFAQRMVESGYRKKTRGLYFAIGRKFGEYIALHGLGVECLTEQLVDQFLAQATAGRDLRDGGRLRRRFWRKPLLLLLEQLRVEGVVAHVSAPPEAPSPSLAEYLAFLREHRGLCPCTVDRHRLHVTRFLAHLAAQTEDDLRRLTIESVDRYLIQAARRLARESIGSVCAALRGYLGFLHMQGTLGTELRGHVTTPRIYSLERMPRSVAWSEVERTLATVDRTVVLGLRDYAILVLLAFGGLRAGDVAALRLDDVDWRHDLVRVCRSKTDTPEDLPLVPTLGEPLIAYLCHRPEAPHNALFLTVKAPIQPVTANGVSQIAQKYLGLAQVQAARLGSHTLRHSLAVELLQRGHALEAIGNVLGHHHPESTFVYAKADLEHLREVALETSEVWP